MKLKIHQALHGYSDGHRLIAGSLPLSSSDARLMIVMSDLSGAGVKPESVGYLTGYPLESSGKYVLARTWAAPEMPRPGCVWTHSLIVDNADLAALRSASPLLSKFHRPDPSLAASQQYAEPLDTSDGSAGANNLSPKGTRAAEVLNAIYAAPDERIVTEVSNAMEDERLVLAIWMQQWPRLRRSFSFCTFAGVDRSGKGASLDLQFLPSLDRSARARFPGAVTPSEVSKEPLLDMLIEDLEMDEETNVRKFLRRAGGDVEGGRRAMLPLCALYTSLFSDRDPNLPAAVRALDALGTTGSKARSVRYLVAKAAIDSVDEVDDAVFDFIIGNIDLGSSEQSHSAASNERVGASLWRRSPTRFVDSLGMGGPMGHLSAEALRSIPAPELVAGLKDHPELASEIVSFRPELLERVDFWSSSEIDAGLASNAEADNASQVAGAMLRAGRLEPTPFIIGHADLLDLLTILNGPPHSSTFESWMAFLARDDVKVAAVLKSGKIKHRSVIAQLARFGDPDAVLDDVGMDPWLVALHAAKGDATESDEDFLSAFIMARALGSRSKSQANLMQASYTRLYRAIERGRLEIRAMNMVRARLDWGWFGWNDCARLRETVVERFIDQRLDPEVFGQLSPDGKLALAIFDDAARTARGRRYLVEVRKRLLERTEKSNKVRASHIAKLLN